MACTVSRCCCMELPKAGITIGILTLIGSLFQIIKPANLLIEIHELEENGFNDEYGAYDAIQSVKHRAIFFIFGYILFALAGVLLIIGSKTKSHLMLCPWILLQTLSVGYGLKTFATLLFLSGSMMSEDHLALVVGGIIGISIGIYLWIVIYSLYCMIEKEKKRPVHFVVQPSAQQMI